MQLDYYRFLIIKTDKRGACSVLFGSDKEELTEQKYFDYSRIYKADLLAQEFRLDIYKFY